MTENEMTKEKLAQVEKILRADIRWAIRHPKYKWDPNIGASYYRGRWGSADGGQSCGVCAVAAHVVRHQPKWCDTPKDHDDGWAPWGADIVAAAKSLGVSEQFMEDVYSAVTFDTEEIERARKRAGTQLGISLRAYADAYEQRYRAQQRKARAAARAAQKQNLWR